MFELSVEDMDLIEQALRLAITVNSASSVDETDESRQDRETSVRKMHDLLGRLHDQKIFYRPKSGTYIGG
nr:hypothetical protein [Ruegeria lacuscaerulensis]